MRIISDEVACNNGNLIHLTHSPKQLYLALEFFPFELFEQKRVYSRTYQGREELGLLVLDKFEKDEASNVARVSTIQLDFNSNKAITMYASTFLNVYKSSPATIQLFRKAIEKQIQNNAMTIAIDRLLFGETVLMTVANRRGKKEFNPFNGFDLFNGSYRVRRAYERTNPLCSQGQSLHKL